MNTEQQALEKIKAKLGKTQKISDRTILESVKPLLAFANEETLLDDFVERVYPALDSANRNHIADVANEIKAYKEANPITTPPAPITPPTELTATDKILQELENLKIQFSGLNNEKVATENKTKLIAGLKAKSVDEKFIENFLTTITIDHSTNVDETITKGETFYNAVKSQIIPPTPMGGGGKSKTDDEFTDIVELSKPKEN